MSDIEMLCCPFCQEPDFDEIGLKWHLLVGGCADFDAVQVPPRPSMFGQHDIPTRNELDRERGG